MGLDVIDGVVTRSRAPGSEWYVTRHTESQGEQRERGIAINNLGEDVTQEGQE
jgi:hypothetical protein